ncbi:hypothetical protein BASA62_001186 [Batrachochytrium salamandrivorans]|nr:hypothetical protein BASA62_001186 [Batrachochytrium salamandrivorans]
MIDPAVIERVLPLYNTREERRYAFDAALLVAAGQAGAQDPVMRNCSSGQILAATKILRITMASRKPQCYPRTIKYQLKPYRHSRHHVPSKNLRCSKVALELPNQDMSPLLQPSNDATIPAGKHPNTGSRWHHTDLHRAKSTARDIQLNLQGPSPVVSQNHVVVFYPFGTSSPLLTHPVTQIQQRTSGEHCGQHAGCCV